MRKIVNPKDKYACMTDEEREQADRSRKLVNSIIDLMKAVDSLMGEVTGHSVTDWGLVNDALLAANKTLKDHVQEA